MWRVTKSYRRLALAFSIFLAIFSTGLAIAQQCHTTATNQVATGHSHSDHHAGSTNASISLNLASGAEGLIDTGCAALFIVILLLAKKVYDARDPRARLNRAVNLARDSYSSYRPQVFQFALSRPQLGVIRI
jgi:hypothetical protein